MSFLGAEKNISFTNGTVKQDLA